MKKIVLIIFTLIFISGFVFAIPSIPNVFSGTVEYSGDKGMSLTGYDISASIGSYGLGVVGQVGEDNFYNIMVDPQGRSGEIHFYIGGVEAEETSTYSAGEFTDLDLTINEYPSNSMCGNGIQEPGEQCDVLDLGVGTCENVLGILGATGTLSCTEYCTFDYSNCTAPYCGDGTCNAGETCSSCPADCGACSGGACSSGGGGGGGGSSGGGGGSFSPTTNTNTQTTNDFVDLNIEIEKDESDNLNSNENQETTSPGITGAVIGFVKTGRGIGIIIVLVILIAGIGVIFMTRKSPKNE